MTEMVDTVRKAVELLNEGDIDTFYELLAEDCVFTSPMGEMKGRQAIIDGDRALLTQIDGHWRRLERGPIISGDAIVTWGLFGGTVKATGKSFEMEACMVMHVNGDAIVAWESYSDFSKIADAWSP